MAKKPRSKRRSQRPARPTRPKRRARAGSVRKSSAPKARRTRQTKARKSRKVAARPRRRPPAKPRRSAARRAKPATRKKAVRKPAAPRTVTRPAGSSARPRTTERPALDRNRRVLPDEERLDLAAAHAAGSQDRMLSAARSGHDDLRNELGRHTETSPALTAGDVDAKWQDAYSVGDEAPGGDNPTPDQDRVDDIGRALGIEYQDDQELMGGDEVTERDKHRWELDPASSEDWPHDK